MAQVWRSRGKERRPIKSDDFAIAVLRTKTSPSANALTQMPVKFDTADEDVWINGVAVTIRDDGRADSIEQPLVPAPA